MALFTPHPIVMLFADLTKTTTMELALPDLGIIKQSEPSSRQCPVTFRDRIQETAVRARKRP